MFEVTAKILMHNSTWLALWAIYRVWAAFTKSILFMKSKMYDYLWLSTTKHITQLIYTLTFMSYTTSLNMAEISYVFEPNSISCWLEWTSVGTRANFFFFDRLVDMFFLSIQGELLTFRVNKSFMVNIIFRNLRNDFVLWRKMLRITKLGSPNFWKKNTLIHVHRKNTYD